MRTRLAVLFALALLVGILPVTTTSAQVVGTDVTYTNDADFDLGTLVSVNHDAPDNDQLQLDSPTEPFPFINVAASGRGTVVRINTDTGEVVGEYRTAPEGRGLNPSRTTVDLFGSVWTANREEVDEIDGIPHGSAVKIGLIAGGTRVDAAGSADVTGGYLAPPFGYSTCADRDGDGLIRTSSGLLDTLDWPDASDGLGGPDGLVEDAFDECILIYQRLPDAEQARHVSVDADNNVWVGGFPFEGRMFHKLDGSTGAILDSFDTRDFGCGGYGGLVDGNGIIWSIGWGTGEGPLLRYDPATRTGMCVNTHGGYGLGIDTNGYLWASLWNNGIAKVSPAGVLEPGFPKSTYPTSTTMTAPSPMLVETVLALPAMTIQADPPEGTPVFWLSPNDDWVQSNGNWTPGAIVSLTINDGSGVVYSDSQTADGFGNFNFDLWDVFDLQRGHEVTVSDGTTTKTHIVEDLFVDGVDLIADTVFGRADPGTAVDVWVHGGGNVTDTADGSGNWVADFAGMTDLTYLSDGGSQQTDPDGDATGVWWGAPRFQAAPQDDWVQSTGNWTPGAVVSLSIDDGSGVVYSDSQTADGLGNFNFNLWDVFDIERGHEVTVSDGTTTKTHTVTDLYVDGVDVTGDTVFGRAAAGTTVDVWVHGDGGVTATTDGSGNWIADFSAMTDLTYLSDGGSQQWDADGDSTGVWWSSPKFQANPDRNWVQSISAWTAGANISLTIDDGAAGYTATQAANASGHFNFDLWNAFELQRGHQVTVSDGITTKTHTVIDLYADVVDVVADTVSGRAGAGTQVNLWIHGEGGNTSTTTDSAGHWIVDYSGLADLTYMTEGGAEQSDEDGDSTGVEWFSPRFQVNPDDDTVGSWGYWNPDTSITMTVNGTDYEETATTDSRGEFWFDLPGLFDIEWGHEVAVTDGTTTKTHTVKDLFIANIDVAADTVTGTAEPDAWVHVGAHLFQEGAGRWLQADSSGDWLADFSVAVGDQPSFDVTEATFVNVQEFDDDGDATTRQFGPPVQANRGVAVTAIDNHVWVAASGIGSVIRLDNDGNVLKIIPTGDEPTGVAVDAAGKVWVTNQFSDNTVRVDPNAGADGLGEVDRTVDLGEGAGPYNYSDMTGAVVVGSTSPQGFWVVIQDSGEGGFEWGRLTWNTEPEAAEPAGTEIVVEIRTADSEAGLGGAAFLEVANGELFSSFGRYIEVRVTLKASSGGVSPVLSDIRVQPATIEVPVDIKPASCPNPFNVGKAGVLPIAILGTGDFDVNQVDPASVMLEGVAPLRWAYEDVATPFEPYLGKTGAEDCNELGADGYTDLTLKFNALEISAALGDVADGDIVVLSVGGYTMGGIPIIGEDVIVILRKGKK